jgi:hypothetical protein
VASDHHAVLVDQHRQLRKREYVRRAQEAGFEPSVPPRMNSCASCTRSDACKGRPRGPGRHVRSCSMAAVSRVRRPPTPSPSTGRLEPE